MNKMVLLFFSIGVNIKDKIKTLYKISDKGENGAIKFAEFFLVRCSTLQMAQH